MIAIWLDLDGWVWSTGETVFGWFLTIGGAILTLLFHLVVIGVVGLFALEFFLCLCVIVFRNPIVVLAWYSIAWLVRTSWFWVRGPGHTIRYRKGA